MTLKRSGSRFDAIKVINIFRHYAENYTLSPVESSWVVNAIPFLNDKQKDSENKSNK